MRVGLMDLIPFGLLQPIFYATTLLTALHCTEITALQSVTFRFRNFSVSKLFKFFDGIGIGFEKFWYRKKVSVSVSKKFGIEKSIGISSEIFCIEKGHKYS